MASIESIAAAVATALTAEIAEIDQSSIAAYGPKITAQHIALVGTPLGQSDEVRDFSLGEIETLHRLRFQFWVRAVQGNEAVYVPLARDIIYRAIVALYTHDGEGYTLAVDETERMAGAVSESTFGDNTGASFLLATLTVPVVQVEAA